MPAKRQPIEDKRRIPRQARAEETVTTILEGAAQILEAGGLAAFTTNAVAERAGVSIGTLYQYFADKNALIRALAERELQATLTRVRQALLGEIDPTPEGRVRVMVRAMITAFRGRQRARKAVLQAILSRGVGVRADGTGRGFSRRNRSQDRATSRSACSPRSTTGSSSCCRAP